MVQQYDLRNEIVSFWHEMEEPTVTHNINYMKGERKGIVVRKSHLHSIHSKHTGLP